MKNIRCSLGSDRFGHCVEKFNMVDGWQDEIRIWVDKQRDSMRSPYGLFLVIHQSNETGGTYNGVPDRVIVVEEPIV